MESKFAFKILHDYDYNAKPELDVNNTRDYNFQTGLSGKFICVPGNNDCFLAVGQPSSDEYSSPVGHSDLRDFLSRLEPSTQTYPGTQADGHIAINIEERVVVFYGSSAIYKRGFSREKILPVAYYIKEQTKGKVNTLITACCQDPTQGPLAGFAIRPEGARGYAFDLLYKKGLDMSPFREALAYAKLLETMVIDLN